MIGYLLIYLFNNIDCKKKIVDGSLKCSGWCRPVFVFTTVQVFARKNIVSDDIFEMLINNS